MLALAFLFLVLALIAYFLGAGMVGDFALTLAKLFILLFLVFLILGVFGGALFGPHYHSW